MTNKGLLIVVLHVVILSPLSAQTLLTQNNAEDRSPCWSPDGSSIAFETNRDGNWEIYLMNNDGKEIKRITNNETEDRRPTWHPDGNHILFESKRDGKSELFTYNIKNRETQKIPIENHPYDIMFARFSPNGEHIAFSSNIGGPDKANFNIFMVNHLGKQYSQLTHDSTRSLFPIWTSDSKNFIFFSRRDTDNQTDELYKFNLENKNTKRITHWPKHNFAPALSPDNKTIICPTSMENSRPELFSVNPKNGKLQRLTFNDYGDTEPSFSPDGKTIAWACFKNGNYDICKIKVKDLLKTKEK